MNLNLAVRYMIELAMVIPAAALAIMPVYHTRKVKKPFLFGILAVILVTVIFGGGVLCSVTDISSNTVIFPSMILLFLMYNFCFDLSVIKKLFCFLINSQNSPFHADFSGIVSPKNTNRTPIFYLIQNWCKKLRFNHQFEKFQTALLL